MAKLGNLSEDNQKKVDSLVEDLGIGNYMQVKAMSITKQKQVVKIAKANPATEFLGKCPDSILVYINEAVFDKLDDNMQDILLRDAFNTVHYDGEKDKIIITPQQIMITMDGYETWGEDLINAVQTAVLTAQQMEEEERQRKAEEKASKKKSR